MVGDFRFDLEAGAPRVPHLPGAKLLRMAELMTGCRDCSDLLGLLGAIPGRFDALARGMRGYYSAGCLVGIVLIGLRADRLNY